RQKHGDGAAGAHGGPQVALAVAMQIVARQVGGDAEVGNPQVRDVDTGIVVGELAVVVGVLEQAVARPGVAAHGLVGDEDVVRGQIDRVGVGTHGECGRHGRAAGGS